MISPTNYQHCTYINVLYKFIRLSNQVHNSLLFLRESNEANACAGSRVVTCYKFFFRVMRSWGAWGA